MQACQSLLASHYRQTCLVVQACSIVNNLNIEVHNIILTYQCITILNSALSAYSIHLNAYIYNRGLTFVCLSSANRTLIWCLYIYILYFLHNNTYHIGPQNSENNTHTTKHNYNWWNKQHGWSNNGNGCYRLNIQRTKYNMSLLCLLARYIT